MKFVDLFCGIGGFHAAAKGHECVFASEINLSAADVYFKNFGIRPHGDITKIDASDIPPHDILFAGFPCQAFSKAGEQKGFAEARGTLFFDIARILEHHKPKYILLENVKNLVTHDGGNTWEVIVKTLKNLGYRIPEVPLLASPEDVGIPQHRPRVFIPGVYDPKNVEVPLDVKVPQKSVKSIYEILETAPDPKYNLPQSQLNILKIWDEFYSGINEVTIGFPVWADFFKVDAESCDFPRWKRDFVKKNNELYLNNKSFIDDWLKKHNNLSALDPSRRKFEWQAGSSISSVFDGIVQFRPSGVRVKKPLVFSTLVAMAQIPIVCTRRLSPRECARLQGFPDEFVLDSSDSNAYKQLGNAVNAELVYAIFNELIKK